MPQKFKEVKSENAGQIFVKESYKIMRPASRWNVEAGKEIQSSVYAGTVQVVTPITAVITTKIADFTQLTRPYFFNPEDLSWVVRI